MNAKLNEAQVKKIRSLKGVLSATVLAIRFVVSPGAIYRIWEGRTWKK